MILKEFYWSCIICLVVFLALCLIFDLLIRSIGLNLIFQELVSAFKENTYGNYYLASKLCCKPVRFVVVAEILQLRWDVGGGLHVGANCLVLLVCCSPFSPHELSNTVKLVGIE